MVRFQCVSSLENGLDIKRAGEFVKEAIEKRGCQTDLQCHEPEY